MTRSFHEDASEDFSNIEERISFHNLHIISTQKKTKQAVHDINFGISQFPSRAEALRPNLAGDSSAGFCNNTFENSSMFDENNTDKKFIGS